MMYGDLSICNAIDKSNWFQIIYISLQVLYNQTKLAIKILI